MIDRLHFGFDDDPPTMHLARQRQQPNWWPRSVKVDPCPCYPHARDMVLYMARFAESAFPVLYPPTYNILAFECLSRTNGETGRDHDYGADTDPKVRPWEPFIILSGKRVPIHPVITRYLVAHEYGHVVDMEVSRWRGDSDDDAVKLRDEYAKVRGIPVPGDYEPGLTHHLGVGEVFANDFRVHVMGVEPEFWPHPYPLPGQVPAVVKFWGELIVEAYDRMARRNRGEPEVCHPTTSPAAEAA